MRERPILFSGLMVRALLNGTKTQTRRVVKPHTHPAVSSIEHVEGAEFRFCAPDRTKQQYAHTFPLHRLRCPYGVPGDRLWVRETHYVESSGYVDGSGRLILYRADGEAPVNWTPSIHMPRWASRLTLRITDVRVERLQDISEADARAEGVDWASPQPWGERWTDDDREDPREVGYGSGSFARDNFRRLWDSLNGRGAWDANPWVWVVAFERVDGARAAGGAHGA